MIGRSLLRQQTYRWTSCSLFSSTERPHPHDPTRDYFGRERKVSEFEKAQDASAPWWLRAFATKTRRSMELYRYNPKYFTVAKFKAWKDRHWRNSDIMAQSYIKERHTILGSDLATAHFIVHRRGKVKFTGRDEWFFVKENSIRCEELPSRYTRGWYIEAVDATGTGLRYEGLVNFVNLKKIKWFRLKNCEHVDNWFIDRITGELGRTLEYLDLSGCTQLTEEMISCMYRCKNLKELDLTGVPTNQPFQLGCLLLEDIIPGLKITGVDYLSTPIESAQQSLDGVQN